MYALCTQTLAPLQLCFSRNSPIASLYKDTHLVITSRLKNIQLSLSLSPFNKGHEPASPTHVQSLRLQTPGWLLDKHNFFLTLYLDVWERAKQPTGQKLAEIILHSEDTFLFLPYFSLLVPYRKASREKQTERETKWDTQIGEMRRSRQ